MTDSQANIIAGFMAFIVQVALISLGVYFIGEALGQPLRFFQITTNPKYDAYFEEARAAIKKATTP